MKARRYARLAVAVALSLGLVVAAVLLLRPTPTKPAAERPSPTPSATPSPTPAADPCASPATSAFTPTRIGFLGIARGLRVLALPRDGHNVPSVPPISNAGKHQVAWDRPPGIKPGASRGNVLLNAHTWPDGSALGNALLKKLKVGNRIIVRGDSATLCYKVDRRVEVLASSGFPEYYDKTGPPHLAIIVCSGRRLGPGNWTHRTIWFAAPEPAADGATASTSPSP
jgi:hypothetical protein